MPQHTLDLEIDHLISRSILECGPRTSVSEVVAMMAQRSCSSIVVVDQGQVVGIWTERDALALGEMGDALSRPIADLMSYPVLALDCRTRLGDAALYFKSKGIRHCLVVDDSGRPLGMLSQTDLVMNQGAEYFLRLRPIHSVKVPPPVIVDPEEKLAAVMRVMRSGGLSAVVVRFPGDEYGILTERDVVRLAAANALGGIVSDHASRRLHSLAHSNSLYSARKFLSDNRLRHVGVLDAQGELTGLLSLSDILCGIEHEYVHELRTALHERDEALRRSNYHLRLADRVFESTLDGVMVTDLNGVIEQVNPAFTQLTGYTLDEVIGRTPRMLSSGRQGPSFYQEMWSQLRAQGHWKGEIWNRRKNGELYLEHLSVSSICNQAGECTHYAAIFSDITHRRIAEERLNHLAMHDPLTDLPNRTLFSERLKQAIIRARRASRRVAVLFLDLDRFKMINDTMGHGTGDDALRVIAMRLKHAVRESDTVARLGGDEFTIVVEEIEDIRHVAHIAQVLLDVVGQPIDAAGRSVFVTPSIGISIYPDDGTDQQQLLMQADRAMYEAKQEGKNTFRFFATQMTSSAMESMALECELRRALTRREFRLHYQPIYDLGSGRIVSVEALLRWQHPTRGLLSPGAFIDVAEESALIVPIGAWVLREACRQGAAWLRSGFEFGRMSVNVSARQIRHEHFLHDVSDVLSDAGMQPEHLQLELVESMAMTGNGVTELVLGELARRGVGLAIDDFGTGYSSFTYLQTLPVNTVKVDRSFLTAVIERERDGAILRAIVAMARALGLTVVAEGVENIAQLQFLREIGCDRAQGFLLARPGPAEALTALGNAAHPLIASGA
ncbi:MAG: diguanylate cyclase [Burkholderiaceae bacterium]|jgi:diguanylate cyclase (GGDEF)-like protein/PAS domain S-box-containing protein|uniref:EAL domain-containing protein n=1 Tax=Cupriavidus metallidurans TaxID=119219 RepID=A0A482IXT7_9BURK|nr:MULTISPECIES: EAL domain-containing protein [Cupriavidus]KWR75154.1 diguanylate cyclase [Cupriavidus sp. SHE]PCH58675.1 MAG: diguanylate cyclase [Burkholderiaceae bacterium]QBP13905.1 EAL domain-containing protein [Cupriavidus metallidurans]QWC91686.1 EAL domain-containing protein [Cupriavidus metallidurans]